METKPGTAQQNVRNVRAGGTRLIPLTRGLAAVVDEADFDMLSGMSWQAHIRRDGRGHYAVSSGRRMHRLIMQAPAHMIVDHINGDGLDNRRCNLRIGTQSLNGVNRKTTPGLYLRGARPKKGLWQAYIKTGGKQKSLGYFATEHEAHAAYLREAHQRYGDWMPLSEPPTPGDAP